MTRESAARRRDPRPGDALRDGLAARRGARAATIDQGLLALTGALTAARAPDDVGAALRAHALPLVGASAVAVALLVDGEPALELVCAPEQPDDVVAPWRRFALGATTPMGQAARAGAPVYAENPSAVAARFPAIADFVSRLGARSVAAIPVHGADGRVRGAVGWVFGRPRALDATTRSVLVSVSQMCADAVVRSRPARAVEGPGPSAAARAIAGLRRLTSVMTSLARSVTAREVTETITEEAIALVGAHAGAVARLTANRDAFELLFSSGYAPGVLAETMRVPTDAPVPINAVFRTGEPLFLESLAEWTAQFAKPPISLAAGEDGAWAVLPMFLDGRLSGVLALSFPRPRAFAPEDRALAAALAQQCGLALERARLDEAARAADVAKRDFLAAASHELRTPLTAIVGFAELLDDGIYGELAPPQRTAIRRVRSGAEHLNVLLSDVLTHAQVVDRTLTPRLTLCRLDELVDKAVESARPLIEKKRLRVAHNAPPGGVELATDCDMVEQIVVNLVANAVKFTEHGEVVVTTRSDELYALLEVRDTGMGIPPDALGRVFTPFWQADQRYTRRAGGLGIGLTVARDLARLLGGDVRVRSRVGEGSVFTAWWPRALDQADALRQAAPATAATLPAAAPP